jgi:hypothetical protein
VTPVTFKLNVQELLTAIVPAASETLPDPAVAVTVPVPHVPVNPLGVAITSPEGRESLNATPVSGIVLAVGLVMVKLSEVDALSAIPAAPNVFTMVGGEFIPVPDSVTV